MRKVQVHRWGQLTHLYPHKAVDTLHTAFSFAWLGSLLETVSKSYILASFVSLKKYGGVTPWTYMNSTICAWPKGLKSKLLGEQVILPRLCTSTLGDKSISESLWFSPWSALLLQRISESEYLIGFSVILVFGKDKFLKQSDYWWFIPTYWLCSPIPHLRCKSTLNRNRTMWAALKLQALPKALTLTLGLTRAAFIFPDQQCPPDFKFQRATQNSWPASYLRNGILMDLIFYFSC